MKNYLLISTFVLWGFILNLHAQTITIDSTFTTDGEIFPFTQVDSIYGLSLSGHVTLNSDTSLVRVILVDENYDEYMVYEAYPLIVPETVFSISNLSDETKFLNKTKPYSLLIYLENAEFDLSSISYLSGSVESADSLQFSHKTNIELQKVSYINEYISRNQMLWRAGLNEVVLKPYSEKKLTFGSDYNMIGFDYYKGGIYDITMNGDLPKDNSTLTEHFDWRTRHNAHNNPVAGNPYYDGNNGWLTPVGNQDCNHCWLFAPLHQTEAMVNLYFNQQLNFDLSEQELASCVNFYDDCDGGFASSTLSYIKTTGVVNENCFTYPYYDNLEPSAVNVDCDLICDTPQERIQVTDWEELDIENQEMLKKAVIEYGPITINIDNWWHYVVLIGYGKVKLGDTIYFDTLNQDSSIIIGENGNYLEYVDKTYWICKNSYGTGWGSMGYIKLFCPLGRMPEQKIIEPPVLSTSLLEDDIKCIDWDKDGYYNWGISKTKPSTCPDCHDSIDSNDDNPRIGPFDENYYGVPVQPVLNIIDHQGDIVSRNGFSSFYGVDDTIHLVFTIRNRGDAQLNLNPLDKIDIAGPNEADFSISAPPDHIIPMNSYTTFELKFVLSEPANEAKIAYITVNVTEKDIEPFTFALVFNNCSYDPNPEMINLDTQWDWVFRNRDVVVSSGVTLTITGSAAFAPQASLFIEPGGKVYVDGGKLTKLCHGFWKGVDVWGSGKGPQNYQQYYGLIKLQNGGKIEYADIGIETIKYVNGEPDYNTTGGMVMISDGAIENCRTGIRFYPFENIHPVTNEVIANLSYFKNASFEISNLFYQYDTPFYRMVWLEEVDQINFQGCSFINSYKPGLGQSINRGTGIYSFLSSFSVNNYDPYPTPGEITRSTFSKLEYGIKALSERTSQLIRVDSAYFEDNLRGIYLSLCENNAELIWNDFLVRDNESVWSTNDKPVGIYTDYFTTGFIIEENHFYSNYTFDQLDVKQSAGIVINNSGGDANEIYRNTFDSLYVAIIGQGENRNALEETGLCVNCNNFNNNWYDVYVHADNQSADQGIAENQGSFNYPAGNLFTENPDVLYHIKDVDDQFPNGIDYYYHYNIAEFPNLYPSEVTTNVTRREGYTEYDAETSCPSNYSGGSIENLKTMMYISESTSDSLSQELVLLVDDGDTPGLESEVSTSFPDEAMEVRAELLNSSPYLSDTVMKASVNKEDVLNNAMIRDVLVANPQSAKSVTIMNLLDERNDPMPQYMKDEILQGKGVLSPKDQLESRLAYQKLRQSKAHKFLTKLYLSDISVVSLYDSLRNIAGNNIYNYYNLAFTELKQGDTLKSDALFDSIPVLFSLSYDQQNEFDNFEQLYDLRRILKSNHKTIRQLDSTQILMLMDLSSEPDIPGALAMNTLIALDSISYNEPVHFPPNFKSLSFNSNNGKQELSNQRLKIYPNPAKHYITVDYLLHEDAEVEISGHIHIFDQNGKIIDELYCLKNRDQFVYSTEHIVSGVYYCCLIVNDDIWEVVKFIVSK